MKKSIKRRIRHTIRVTRDFFVKYKFILPIVLLVVIVTTGLLIASCSDADGNEKVSDSNEISQTGMNESSDTKKGGLFSIFTKGSDAEDEIPDEEAEAQEENPVVLAYKEDAKEGYMNNCVFLGDSRTVAMVSYGLLQDDRVLAKVGISHTAFENTPITNNSGREYTMQSFLMAHQAPVVYINLGVNGMNGISEDKYKSTYEALVDHVVSMAPNSSVVLMSIGPVDDYGTYKNSVQNSWINKYNEFLKQMAANKGLHYLNVAEILLDDNGQLKKDCDSGDGLHFRASTYSDILKYIIHHPVPGVSDTGEYKVKYIKPSGEYKKIMTEDVPLPANTEVVTYIPEVTPTATPTVDPYEQQRLEEERKQKEEEERKKKEKEEEERRKKEKEEEERKKREAEQQVVTPIPTTKPEPAPIIPDPTPTQPPEPTPSPTPEVTPEPTPTQEPEAPPASDPEPEPSSEDASGESDS